MRECAEQMDRHTCSVLYSNTYSGGRQISVRVEILVVAILVEAVRDVNNSRAKADFEFALFGRVRR